VVVNTDGQNNNEINNQNDCVNQCHNNSIF
jgi:hypothetical protein